MVIAAPTATSLLFSPSMRKRERDRERRVRTAFAYRVIFDQSVTSTLASSRRRVVRPAIFALRSRPRCLFALARSRSMSPLLQPIVAAR